MRVGSLILSGLLWLFICINWYMPPPCMAEERGEAYYDLGVFAFEDGDYASAEQNFKTALQAEPENSLYRQYLGKTYLKMERYKEALADFTMVWKTDPRADGLKYDMAQANMKLDNYPIATYLLVELLKEEPDNILAHYHLGICLFKRKRYAQAEEHFTAAAEASPSIKINGYYYAGICQLQTGQPAAAAEKFAYIVDHTENEQLRAQCRKWLRAARGQAKAVSPLALYLKLGFQLDDNVPQEPVDQDLYTDQSDIAGTAYFSGRYHILNGEKLKIGVGYNHYQTKYYKLSEYDLIGSIPNVYAKYRLAPFTMEFTYQPTFYWLGGESYMLRQQVRPQISWDFSDSLTGKLTYNYYGNNHFLNPGRTGHTNAVSADVYFRLPDQKGLVFAALGGEDNSPVDPDYDYLQIDTKAGVTYKLFWGIVAGATVRYRNKNYDNIDSTYGIERRDDQFVGEASLSHQILFDWLRVGLEYTYTRNISTIDVYDYRRNVFTISLTGVY